MKHALFATVVVLGSMGSLFGGGCGGDSKSDAKADEKKVETTKVHTCKIMIAEDLGDEKFKGNAGTEAEALAAACEKAPEDKRSECGNAEVFSKSVTEVTVNDQKQFNVALAPVAKQFDAEKESEETVEAACTAALAQACKAGGEAGDCVASGKFRKAGEITNSR